MFSATFPSKIQCLASDVMRENLFVTVGHVGRASKDQVAQKVMWIEEKEKCDFLGSTSSWFGADFR